VSEFVGAYPESAVKQFFEQLLPTEADRLAAAGEAAASPEEAESAFRSALDAEPRHRRATLGLASLLAARGDLQDARDLLAQLPEDADVRKLKAHIDLAENADAPADGDWEPVLENLLAQVRADGEAGDARQRMLDIFEVLGPDHPLTRTYRSRLASALF
jgi:putative thioredoxin